MAVLSIASLQRLNNYELDGTFGNQGRALDDLVIEHLTLEREMQQLSVREQLVMRLLVERYSVAEIADELAVSVRSVGRCVAQLRLHWLESDPRKAA